MSDPKIEYRKGMLIALLFLSLGVAQLVFVISARSQLIWRYKPGPISGNHIVRVPESYLIPNSYVFTIGGLFPHILDENVVGNVTLVRLKSGRNYTINYNIEGYLKYQKLILDARLFKLSPGRYNISWVNNVSRFEYYFTTHGLFNLFPQNDRYPYLSETVFLVISIFGLIAFLVAAIKKYLKVRQAYAFHR
ncbi:MAG: hypothetical protein ACFFA3_17210 [Promethearchaeota archaeon]